MTPAAMRLDASLATARAASAAAASPRPAAATGTRPKRAERGPAELRTAGTTSADTRKKSPGFTSCCPAWVGRERPQAPEPRNTQDKTAEGARAPARHT